MKFMKIRRHPFWLPAWPDRELSGKTIPGKGKSDLHAAMDGLLSVNAASLAAFNMIDEVMCATLHSHTLVKKGELVAATRAIPLIMKRAPVERAAAIAAQNGGTVSVAALRKARAGLIVTGNEVFYGLIADKFVPVLSAKVTDLGSEVAGAIFTPDDEAHDRRSHPQAYRQRLRPVAAERRYECGSG